MLNNFEKKCTDFIKENALLPLKTGILFAVSGGADSMALMYAMVSLKAAGAIKANLVVGHIHHHLRGKLADADRDFVVACAKQIGLKTEVVDIDVRGFAKENKISIETAGRDLRRKALLGLAKKNNCEAIATGHHKNDNAETVIDRLIRGTGIRGLGGIWPKKNFDGIDFVRPLLWATKKEIIEYLQNKNLRWCEDHTNEDLTYRRNFIRHKLLDHLQNESPGIIGSLSNLSKVCRNFHELVEKQTGEIWPNVFTDENVALDLNIFLEQPESIKIELIRRCFSLLNCGQQNVTATHYKNILQLAEVGVGNKKVELPDGFFAIRQYDKLVFEKSKADSTQIDKALDLKIGKTIEFGHWQIGSKVLNAKDCDIEKFKMNKDNFIEWFDLDKIKLPFKVCFRKPGDKFFPLGMIGEKKLGKFLTTSKAPYDIRENAVVIADAEKIVWLAPIRASELTKIDDVTSKIVELEIKKA